MAELTGSEILAKSLKNEGTKDFFYIMGGPMMLAENSCIKEGIRPIDVRHEQAAALMAQAYSRLLQKPGVCMAASGPGVINLTTGVANALIDCAPGGPNDYVYVYTSRGNPQHWPRLLEAIGRKDLIGDPRYDTQKARVEHEAEIDAIISEWTRKHDKYEAMRVIGAAVPAGAVRDTFELMNDPNFGERGIIQTIEHPAHGPFKMAGWPVRFNGHPPPVTPAPLLGQHSAEALKDWLGMTEEQVATLRADKII